MNFRGGNEKELVKKSISGKSESERKVESVHKLLPLDAKRLNTALDKTQCTKTFTVNTMYMKTACKPSVFFTRNRMINSVSSSALPLPLSLTKRPDDSDGFDSIVRNTSFAARSQGTRKVQGNRHRGPYETTRID